jgi:transposase
MFMTSKRYTEEFKIEAVKQVTDRGYSVAEVAERLGTTTHSLYAWMKRYGQPNPRQANKVDDQAEIAKLKADLRRVTEERDILKKAAAYFANDHG